MITRFGASPPALFLGERMAATARRAAGESQVGLSIWTCSAGETSSTPPGVSGRTATGTTQAACSRVTDTRVSWHTYGHTIRVFAAEVEAASHIRGVAVQEANKLAVCVQPAL